MSDAVRVTAGNLAGVAVVLRALADARWTVFQKLRLHATLRWPGLTSEVSLVLNTHHLDTASHVFLTLSVPRSDGTEVEWGLVVWIAPDVVTATGHVYAKDVRDVIVDHVFDCTEEATEAADAAEMIRSMASRVCAERRFLES